MSIPNTAGNYACDVSISDDRTALTFTFPTSNTAHVDAATIWSIACNHAAPRRIAEAIRRQSSVDLVAAIPASHYEATYTIGFQDGRSTAITWIVDDDAIVRLQHKGVNGWAVIVFANDVLRSAAGWRSLLEVSRPEALRLDNGEYFELEPDGSIQGIPIMRFIGLGSFHY